MNALDRWLHGAYDGCTGFNSGVFRVVYAAALLLFFLPKGLWIVELNGAFFVPPFGIGFFVPGLPAAWLIYAANFLLTLLATLLLVGWRTRSVSILLAVSYFVASIWTFSAGKVNHDILFVAVPFVMAFSDWGEHHSLDARRSSEQNSDRRQTIPFRSWPFAFYAMIVCIGMFTAVIPKVDTGYLLLESQAVRSKVIGNIIFTGRESFVADILLRLGPKFAWEALDWATVVLEASFLLVLFRLRFLRKLLPIAALFHVGIFYMMEIAFTSNIIAYCAFVDWQSVLSTTRAIGRRRCRDREPGERELQLEVRVAENLLPSWVAARMCVPASIGLTIIYLFVPEHVASLRTLGYTFVFWPLVAIFSMGAILSWVSRFGRRSQTPTTS